MRRLCVALLVFLASLSLFAGDIRELYEELAEKHVDFFNAVPEAYCEDYVALLEEECADCTDAQLYYALDSVAALAQDSHTQVALSVELVTRMHFLPIGFDRFSDGLYVVWACSDWSDLVGRKVETIAGCTIDMLMDYSSPIIPHDNDVHLFSQLRDNHLVLREFYETIGLVDDGEELVVGFADGSEASLPFLGYEDYVYAEKSTLQQALPKTLNPGALYSAMALDDPESLLINYHSCQDWAGYPMAEFTNDVRKVLEDGGYRRLIIDLRYNGGGDSSVLSPMIDMLSEWQDVHSLAVYVLIGEGTFSSAILNAIELEERLDATFVGRPTGGSHSHYGELGFGVLSLSGLSYTYSTKHFGNGESGPLQPDILVERDVEDYIKGRDSELAALGVVE